MDVAVEQHGNIAVLTIDRPPVNALSHSLRILIAQRFEEVAHNDAVTGVVIACAGKTFIVGADIEELGHVNPPMLRDLIEMLQKLDKPSAAAIHGTALGGGMELALGCTFRVALADARIGLPEVKLGLLPGAGGTVHTTYLAGPEATLKLAGSGSMMPVAKARDIGLVDAVFEDDLVASAVTFLASKISAGDIPPPVSARGSALQPIDEAAFSQLTAELCRKARSAAPKQVAEAVRNATTLSFADARREERRLFIEALDSPRFGALRHLFFAERTAARPSGVVAEAKPLPVEKVAVIGAGTMGTGIAMAFANSGFSVQISEVEAAALQRGLDRIRDLYQRSVVRGSLDADEAERRIGRISGTIGLDALGDADLIVEAIYENMAAKKAVFAGLDKIAKPGAILATNTSYLDVNEIAGATQRASHVLGLHFFSPANVMTLLEVVRAAETQPQVIATALKVARQLGKQPVVVNVCHGFVGNRMLQARNRQLSQLLLEGAAPADIDKAFRDFGWPMGPCQMQDLAGLDIGWANRKAQGLSDSLPDQLCELGRFGQKTGKGWYLYDGSGKQQADPEVDTLIERLAAELGIERRTIDAEEIIDRTHGPMIEEGRRILEEGVVERSSDIDVVWVHGYGFPRDLGGPIYWHEHLSTAARP